MFIASALNFLVDLGLLGLLVCITRPTDNSHPLAALVTVSTAPYWARLYPIVVQTATYNTDPFYARPTNTTLRFIITNAIDTRDQAYESMMLYTVVFTWIMGGAYTIEGLLRSIREDRELTVCQTRRRALIPMTLGLLLAMMIYNNMFEPLVPEFYDDIPHTHRGGHVLQLGLSSAILTLIIAVVFAYCRLRKMPTPATPVQEAAFRHIRSLIVFFALSSFPLIYIMYQMSAWLRAPPNGGHFQFANYVCYIRLIYMFAFAFLEPYSTRLRGRCLLRDSCGSPPVAPSPANFSGPGGAASFPPLPRTASEPAGPLPDKGTYEAPPSYEAFPSTYELPRNVVVGTPMPMPPAFEDVVLADAAKRGVTPIA